MPRFKTSTGPSQAALEQRASDAIAVTDETRRRGLVRAERIESAKAASLARERSRLVARTGAGSPQVKRLDGQIAAHAAALAATRANSQRSQAPAAPLATDRSVIHGRVVDAHTLGVTGLTVVAADANDRVAARGVTNANGYFLLDLPAARSGKPTIVPTDPGGRHTVRPPAPHVAPAAPADAVTPVHLVVSRGNEEVYRGKETFPLTAQLAEYRELTIRT
jgi:hypothetical protein